ncbi:MAG: EAL domain-containing protein [Burkholderiales bacterium]|nr:EAL domain-containing protein [Burkholderiales bacterium]
MSPHRTHGLRVARRVAGLFVACALLPVALTLALSYGHVRDALLDQRSGQLRDAAETFGAGVFDRLGVAEILGRHAVELLAADPAMQRMEGLAGYFRTVAVTDGTVWRILTGRPGALPDPRVMGNAVPEHTEANGALAMASAADGSQGVWIEYPERPAAAQPRKVAVELDPRFLWGSADDLPYMTDVCVLDARGEPLYCTAAPPAAALAALRGRMTTSSKGNLAWTADGVRRLSGYRELFLKGKFGAESWAVVATQPEEYATGSVLAVRKVVVPVVVLGLLFAAFLALVQVRRTLGPLRELTEATARIAARDFQVRVASEDRGDEFGTLAAAFNSMSARLGHQFQALEANAEIDGVILSGIDMAQLAAIVLRRAAQLVRSGRCALLLAERGKPGTYRAHTPEDPEGACGNPVSLSGHESTQLAGGAGGLRICAGDAQPVAALAAMGIRDGCALPVLLGDELAALLVLEIDRDRKPDHDDLAHLRGLCDRIAVALATARRDEELHRSAYYDALTQLPNRRLGMEQLARAVAGARRNERKLAVMFVDLDGFSAVNDSLGHAAGDRVLVEAAARLRECVRRSDMVARLGGDEFAVVLDEVRGEADAALVAGHVIEALSLPFRAELADAFMSASVGIALFPGDGEGAEELLRHADLAMYQAKQRGRRQLAFFEPSMDAEVQRRLTLDRELRQALPRGEFTLFYQPQLDIASGRVIGAEALIRWIHPERGLVPPGQFIPYAESCALIEDIGAWALRAAAMQYMAWRAQGIAIEHVSVNVAPRQFRNPSLVACVEAALRAAGMPAHALRLEITESSVIDNEGPVEANLAGLVSLGIVLELDDFGTGYASLAYLQRLPVATVKIDQSLVRDIETNEGHRAVVHAAIEMVHALGKTAIAEGVESAEQLALLEKLGCDAAQGYLLSRPVPPEKFAALVTNRPASARAAA